MNWKALYKVAIYVLIIVMVSLFSVILRHLCEPLYYAISITVSIIALIAMYFYFCNEDDN